MTSWSEIERQVEQRAGERCEYCRMHQALQGATFHVEHIPRPDSWNDHFRWEEYRLVPLTAIGRGTVAALDLNQPRRILIRQAEELFDFFPPGAVE